MSDYHFAIIDGTGDWSDEDYDKSMYHSFCHQMFMQIGKRRCDYMRGPSFDGYYMNSRGKWAQKVLTSAHEAGRTRLFLAGYSRGGVAAVMAAEYLFKSGIDIEALFLFDPVARHLSKGGGIIPPNVRNVIIARRQYTKEMVERYDYTTGVSIPLIGRLIFHNPIRTSFDYAQFSYTGKTSSDERYFLGSHGALGGVGWEHVVEDRKCEHDVIKFMASAFHKYHLPIRLTLHLPMSKPNPTIRKFLGF